MNDNYGSIELNIPATQGVDGYILVTDEKMFFAANPHLRSSSPSSGGGCVTALNTHTHPLQVQEILDTAGLSVPQIVDALKEASQVRIDLPGSLANIEKTLAEIKEILFNKEAGVSVTLGEVPPVAQDPVMLYPRWIDDDHETGEFFTGTEFGNIFELSFPENDPFGRTEQTTSFLKLPLEVPNLMGLCQVYGQRPYHSADEIDPSNMHVTEILLVAVVGGVRTPLTLVVKDNPRSAFVPPPFTSPIHNLNLRLHDQELFIEGLTEQGYLLTTDIVIAGTYDRQLNKLEINGAAELKGIHYNGDRPERSIDKEVMQFFNSIESINVEGLRMNLQLK